MTDLSFKGQRDYLNGATIFDYIVDKFFWGITPPKDINFYINSMTKKKIEVFPIDPDQQPREISSEGSTAIKQNY